MRGIFSWNSPPRDASFINWNQKTESIGTQNPMNWSPLDGEARCVGANVNRLLRIPFWPLKWMNIFFMPPPFSCSRELWKRLKLDDELRMIFGPQRAKRGAWRRLVVCLIVWCVCGFFYSSSSILNHWASSAPKWSPGRWWCGQEFGALEWSEIFMAPQSIILGQERGCWSCVHLTEKFPISPAWGSSAVVEGGRVKRKDT